MYELEQKKYFLIIILIPIILVAYVVYAKVRRRKVAGFSDKKLFSIIAPNYSKYKLFFKLIVWCFVIFLFSLALVNPKIGAKLETVKRKGTDIVFALDVSKSMLAEDVQPSRFQKAKQIISNTINILMGDRIGIIAYAGGAYPLLPITTDYNSAKMFLRNADTDIVPSLGTTIGDAILMASKYFNDKNQKSKLLFIVSDGEDHEEDLSSEIQLAKEQGINIFTIGIGTTQGAPIPIKNNGILQEYKKDNNNSVVITKKDDNKLRSISSETNGMYIDGNKSTKVIVDDIKKVLDNVEKSEYETKKFSDYKDQFQLILVVCLVFLILDIFIFERKTLWFKKLNLFNDKK